MRIDVWSDVVCPWCYIGKRRLEKAIGDRDDVEVVYHSFQLDPSSPTDSDLTVPEYLDSKYGGGPDAGLKMIAQVDAVAAQEGLAFRQAEATVANTLDAHRVLHLALDEAGPSVQARLKEELLAAYFLRAENPAALDVLLAAAAVVGWDADRVRAVVASDEYADAVAADATSAREYGANGVPFFVVEGRYGISGAQPVQTFREVLAKVDAEAKPQLEVVDNDGASDGAGACGPDGCAI